MRYEELTVTNLIIAKNHINIPDAATYSVSGLNTGKIHILPELTADIVVSLPPVRDGLVFEFISKGVLADAQDWQFNTGSDTNFYLGGITELDTTGDTVVLEVPDGNSNSIVNILTPAPSSRVRFICDGTNWIIDGVVQSETADAVTWADQ